MILFNYDRRKSQLSLFPSTAAPFPIPFHMQLWIRNDSDTYKMARMSKRSGQAICKSPGLA